MTDLEQKPRLRFKGFTEAWEQRKLNEIVSYASSSLSAKDAADDGKWNLYDANHLIGKTNLFFVRDDYITIIKDGAGVGRVRLLPKNSAFIGTMGALLPLNSDLLFDYALLTKADLSRKFSGSTIPHIYFKDYGNETYRTPLLLEQQKIGSLFERLDSLITLHQRKYEKLKSMKAALLEKMFPSENETTPKIRFKGFTEAWEQRKLFEITDKVTEKNAGLQYVETFTNSAEFGIISQRDFFDHDIAKLGSLDAYYIVKNEDFVYNPRISTSAPVGPINRNKLGRTGVMSPLYTVFRPHDIDTTYLEYFFKCGYWHSFMNFNGDSGARSDRFSIRDNVFFQMPIPIPDIDEQRKIGELLTCLDNLITLHQRKPSCYQFKLDNERITKSTSLFSSS